MSNVWALKIYLYLCVVLHSSFYLIVSTLLTSAASIQVLLSSHPFCTTPQVKWRSFLLLAKDLGDLIIQVASPCKFASNGHNFDCFFARQTQKMISFDQQQYNFVQLVSTNSWLLSCAQEQPTIQVRTYPQEFHFLIKRKPTKQHQAAQAIASILTVHVKSCLTLARAPCLT